MKSMIRQIQKRKYTFYKELKRLDPDLSIKHKPVVSAKKELPKNLELVTTLL